MLDYALLRKPPKILFPRYMIFLNNPLEKIIYPWTFLFFENIYFSLTLNLFLFSQIFIIV